MIRVTLFIGDRLYRNTFLGCVIAAAVTAQSAWCDPTKVSSGRAQLPVSGLIVDLKPMDGVEYAVSGSWSTDEAGLSFDSRDVLEEIRQGEVVATTDLKSVQAAPEACATELARAKVSDAWTTTAMLGSKTWQVRGGAITTQADAVARPGAVLCRLVAGRTFVIQRLLTSSDKALDQTSIMDEVRTASVLGAISQSLDAGRIGKAYPTRNAGVIQRGGVSPARTAKLELNALTFKIPDDGFFWKVAKNEESNEDLLIRMLPTLPEVQVNITMGWDLGCDEMTAAPDDAQHMRGHGAADAPPGWKALPSLKYDDGRVELAVCYPHKAGALFVGVSQGPDERSVGYLRPLFDALAVSKVDE